MSFIEEINESFPFLFERGFVNEPLVKDFDEFIEILIKAKRDLLEG